VALLIVLKKLAEQKNRPQNHVGRETRKRRASGQRLLRLRMLLKTAVGLESQSWPQKLPEKLDQKPVTKHKRTEAKVETSSLRKLRKRAYICAVFFTACAGTTGPYSIV